MNEWSVLVLLFASTPDGDGNSGVINCIRYYTPLCIKVCSFDWNFKMVTTCFERFFMLQAKIRGKYWALIYSSVSKTKLHSTFVYFFVEKQSRSKSRCIYSWLKSRLFKALQHVFQEARMCGCLFHLRQLVWWKLAAFGFSGEYNNDFFVCSKYKIIFGAFICSFDPHRDIQPKAGKSF